MIVDEKNTTELRSSTVEPNRGESKTEIHRLMQEFVGVELEAVEAQLKSLVRSDYPEVNRLTTKAAFMGGKRLRPVLTILAAKACTDSSFAPVQLKDVVNVAAAVELVHAASLVHDDVMDRAEQRRHQPTIYSISSNSEAILSGDFLFTRAYESAARCRSTFAARELAKAATQLCEGELRQQACVGNWNLSVRDYLDVLRQKTGVLCGVSCFLGAWAAGGNRKQAVALGKFGTKLGIAFQIFDDWLDYWGTEEVGKTLGTDCAQEKPTLPTLRLLKTQGQSPQARKQLVETIRHNRSDFAAVRQLLDSSDASQFTVSCARKKVDGALALLGALPESAAKGFLERIARFSVMRNA